MFEEINHTADLAIKIVSDNINDLFKEAGYGLFFLMYRKKFKKKIDRHIVNLSSNNYETLLIDFLNELIYLNDSKDFVLTDCDIKLENSYKLKAVAKGFNNGNPPLNSIKAATYHNLKIKKDNLKYSTVITFDI